VGHACLPAGRGGGEACPEFVEGGFFSQCFSFLFLFLRRKLALSGELACPELIYPEFIEGSKGRTIEGPQRDMIFLSLT